MEKHIFSGQNNKYIYFPEYKQVFNYKLSDDIQEEQIINKYSAMIKQSSIPESITKKNERFGLFSVSQMLAMPLVYIVLLIKVIMENQ